MIRELYRASQAGVQIDLIVRAHCCLRPGLPGYGDNIRVISILGRFLEHDRIFYFANNGQYEIYIGSADWRRRNLQDRIELLAPIEAPALRAARPQATARFDTLVKMADKVVWYKYVTKNTAKKHGKTVTFMPKPIVGDNGSGMHVHQSLAKGGENIFAGDQYGGLSETALYYIGGIIKHARALNAFTNASTNSYKRLVPGFEAPVMLAYSARNRSASIRIPWVASPKGRRIEVRFPDPTANPYLAFAAMMMAGLDGIQNKIHPGDAMDKDLYDLPAEEALAIPTVCHSLDMALVDLGLPPYPHKPEEGFELIKELINNNPTMKILVLSGQDNDVNIKHNAPKDSG